jgi:uncharacterized protein YjbI with pentapeptide repeats
MAGWMKKADDWINQHRPWALLGTVVGTLVTVALINWFTASDIFRQFFFPEPCNAKNADDCDPLAWRDLLQAAILILGLPVAFMLWHWRDRNVRDQIIEQQKQESNTRRDLNLKEFQEIQLRASGHYINREFPESGEILRLASLHQLRTFLRGEYGSTFQRPALETLIALKRDDTAAVIEIDSQLDFIGDSRKPSLCSPQEVANANSLFNEIRSRFDTILYNRTVSQIIGEDAKYIFCKDFPFELSFYDHVKFCNVLFQDISLANLSFIGSTFDKCRFVNCDLEGSRLNLCEISNTVFENCNIKSVQFIGSKISDTTIKASSSITLKLQFASIDSFEICDTKGISLRMECSESSRVKLPQNEYASIRAAGAQLAMWSFDKMQLGGGANEFGMVQASEFAFTKVSNVSFKYTGLTSVSFVGSELASVDFRGADLRCAYFGSDDNRVRPSIEVYFDDDTKFGRGNFEHMVSNAHDAVRDELVASGFRHVGQLMDFERRHLVLRDEAREKDGFGKAV